MEQEVIIFPSIRGFKRKVLLLVPRPPQWVASFHREHWSQWRCPFWARRPPELIQNGPRAQPQKEAMKISQDFTGFHPANFRNFHSEIPKKKSSSRNTSIKNSVSDICREVGLANWVHLHSERGLGFASHLLICGLQLWANGSDQAVKYHAATISTVARGKGKIADVSLSHIPIVESEDSYGTLYSSKQIKSLFHYSRLVGLRYTPSWELLSQRMAIGNNLDWTSGWYSGLPSLPVFAESSSHCASTSICRAKFATYLEFSKASFLQRINQSCSNKCSFLPSVFRLLTTSRWKSEK